MRHGHPNDPARHVGELLGGLGYRVQPVQRNDVVDLAVPSGRGASGPSYPVSLRLRDGRTLFVTGFRRATLLKAMQGDVQALASRWQAVREMGDCAVGWTWNPNSLVLALPRGAVPGDDGQAVAWLKEALSQLDERCRRLFHG